MRRVLPSHLQATAAAQTTDFPPLERRVSP